MNSLLGVAGIVSGVVGFVVFLGAVVVYLRGSRDKGTIATLEKNNEALTERVDLLEAERARDKAAMDSMSMRLELLERENTALRQQRPSHEAIAELHSLVEDAAALLATHDAQTMAILRRLKP